MKKGKIRSEVSLQQTTSSDVQEKEEIIVPLDVLCVKILSLTTNDDVPRKYSIKVTFFDQIILNDEIQSVGTRDLVRKKTLAQGIMSYDPSDYDRMCLLADHPLCVSIQPICSPESSVLLEQSSVEDISRSEEKAENDFNISCCNVDILVLFIGKDKLLITKRLEPSIPPSVLSMKSWNNLPKILMEISVVKNKANSVHHKLLSEANAIKITLIGAYNMIVPFDGANVYTAATKMPMNMTDEKNYAIVMFNGGCKIPKNFNSSCFYPNWECLRLDHPFLKCDEKFECKIEDITNDNNFELRHYMDTFSDYASLWGSFHRSLLFNNAENTLLNDLRRYKWPFEVHIYNEYWSHSFMAFLDLFRLLYPGETVVRSVVPLHWINADSMTNNCGCDLLLSSAEKASSTQGTMKKPSKGTTVSAPTSTSTEVPFPAKLSDGDFLNSFIFVEVKLARPMRKPVIPPLISMLEITKMLNDMEEQQIKRQCIGRGQLNKEWQATAKSAANSLRRIPYYGMTDICAVNRQLSETRNRVEMVTSFWQDAATNVNNNFVLQDFLKNNNLYEELLMMAHACLLRTAYDTLVGVDKAHELDSILKAARHARQLKDIPHAVDLFLQLIAEKPRDANLWRELATCLKDMDRDWANVCINKSITLNPRHPLTLLSKACMVFEEDPDDAEPFFVALLNLYPFWIPMWVAVNAYYLHRQMFLMAEEIMECVVKTSADGLEENNKFPRTWELELGDWWDHTPLLPGSSLYYEAADLLLRIRAISLAEVCIARALCQSGETAAHYHLVALCCRLRKEPVDALCHLQLGIAKFGDISYLRSLEAECHHKLKNIPASQESFEKAGTCSGPYSILLSLSRRDSKRMRSLLVDLIRRQPNAYAWMALADDWMMTINRPSKELSLPPYTTSLIAVTDSCKLVTCDAHQIYIEISVDIAWDCWLRSASGDYEPSKSEEPSSALAFATACAVQALKWDRRAGRGWALLCKLVKPNARRLFCKTMAIYYCGYNKWSEVQLNDGAGSQQSLCHVVGRSLRECRCDMCEHLAL